MKIVLNKLLLLGALMLPTGVALGVTCTPGDWDAALCELKTLEGTRCVSAEFFRMYCAPGTDGCAAVGGCVGFTPTGHWYALLDSTGRPTRKCQCGCFAEATEFDSVVGPINGSSILASYKAGTMGEMSLTTLGGLDGGLTENSLNSVTYGPETEPSWVFLTQSGKSITVSKAHPMVIGDSSGKVVALKPAEKVEVGDLFLGPDMVPDSVLSVSRTNYQGRLMNFNVASANVVHHIVVANGVLTGDSGWQEQLNNTASRVIWRNDIIKFLNKDQTKQVNE